MLKDDRVKNMTLYPKLSLLFDCMLCNQVICQNALGISTSVKAILLLTRLVELRVIEAMASYRNEYWTRA